MCTQPRHVLLACFTLAAILSTADAAPDPPRPFQRFPDIHGEKVVFTCEGDLWIGDLKSKQTFRLTRDEGLESHARFSPDGSRIAFTASYDGMPEVYVIPTAGGPPTRLTYLNSGAAEPPLRGNEAAAVLDWTPDGRNIAFRSLGQPSWFFVPCTPLQVPARGGSPQRLPLGFTSHLSYAPDGQRFAFTRFPLFWRGWFRYQGGTRNDLWIGDGTKRQFRRVLACETSSDYPVWAGDRICFVRDEGDGTFSVLAVDPEGRSRGRLAGPYAVEIRSMNTDGKRLIYKKGTELELYDLAAGKVVPVRLDLASDLIHTRPYLVPAEKHVGFMSLGPTGKRVLEETRGQILSVPVADAAPAHRRIYP